MKRLRNLFITIILCFAVLCIPGIAKATTGDDIQYLVECQMAPTFNNQSDKPFLADGNNATELIDEQSGALIRRETDLSLPGRDGFNLVIGRNFSTSQATPFERKTTHIDVNKTYTGYYCIYAYDPENPNVWLSRTYANSTAMRDYCLELYQLNYLSQGLGVSSTSASGTYTWTDIYEKIEPNKESDRFGLGVGWSWSFPYIEKHWSAALGKSQLFYHDPSGGTYSVSLAGDKLSGYPYSGYTFGKITEGGVDYYKFVDPTKNTAIFESVNGNPLSMTDRFGNQITFQYDSSNRIDSIIDTVGRTIDFVYTTRNGIEYIDLVVHDPANTETVTYSYAKETVPCPGQDHTGPGYSQANKNIDVKVLKKFIDPMNGEIQYTYNQSSTIFTLDQYASSRVGVDAQLLMSTVKYPHSIDTYGYASFNRSLNIYGYAGTNRVTSRKSNEYDGSGNTKADRDIVTYSYNGDYLPLPTDRYYQAAYTTYDVYLGDPTEYSEVLATSYDYSSTKTVCNGSATNQVLSETNEFQGFFGRKTSSTVTAISGTNAGEKQVTGYEYSYNSYPDETLPAIANKPSKVSTTHYSADNVAGETLSTLYTYDPVWTAIATETLPINTSQQSSPTKYTVTYTYDPNIMLMTGKSWYKSTSDSSPLTESYNYAADESGKVRLLSSTDTMGNLTNYDYDYATYNNINVVSKVTATKNIENGKQAKTETYFTISSGSTTTNYAYPERVKSYFTDSQGNTQVITNSTQYNMLWGQPSSTTDTKGRTTINTYDNLGRVKKVNLPDIASSSGTCNVEQNIVYTPQTVLSSTDSENNNTVTFMVETSTQYTVGGVSTIYNKEIDFYNSNGNLLEKRLYDSTGANPRISQYRYDLMGRAVYAKDPAGNTTSGSYDSFGDMRQVLDPSQNSYFTIKDRKNRTVTTYFTANGGSTQEFLTTANLDQWGRTVSAASNGLTESLTYDLAGNVLTHTDPKGNATIYGYDNANQLKTVTDRLNQITSYNYTILGSLTSVMQTDGTNSWTTNKYYDEMGRIKSRIDPVGHIDFFAYDSFGLLNGSTDPKGTQFGVAYDNADRVSAKTAGATSYNYTYTGSPYGINTIAFNDGAATRTVSYGYNNFGQVQGITLDGHTVNYQYDPAGRVNAVGLDSGNWSLVKYSLDKMNKIQTNGSLTNSDLATDNAVFTYYANGLLDTITYPTLTNGSVLTSKYTYYTSGTMTGRMESVTNKKTLNSVDTILSKYTYTYDNNGNITGITDNVTGSVSAYEYDKLDRLTKVTKNGAIKQKYTYDARGNRDSQFGIMPTMVADAATFNYNVLNQLTSATVGANTTFGYGPTGLRVKKGAKTYIFDANGNVVAEADANNTITATYIWGGNRLLVKKVGTAQYYFLYNGHGDVVQIIDATTGNVVNSYEYDEWGNITSQTEGIANEFKYAGQIFDSETGLYYLRARYYDPVFGRFISKDSVEGDISNPLSLNLYTYCENEPLGNVDPSGHASYPTGVEQWSTENYIATYFDALGDYCREGTLNAWINYVDFFTGAKTIFDPKAPVVVKGFALLTNFEGPVRVPAKLVGKAIPLKQWASICELASHNPNSKKVMLGKYSKGEDCYIVKAGKEYSFFDLGDIGWDIVKKLYNFTNQEMFKLFNQPFLDDAINARKTFYFSHNPIGDEGALGLELDYLLDNGYKMDKVGGQWVAVPKS